MTYVGRELNEYGTAVGVFDCDTCGMQGYTICPEPAPEDRWMWQNCMTPECESFDISRDVGAILGFGWGELHGQDNHPITLTHEGSNDD